MLLHHLLHFAFEMLISENRPNFYIHDLPRVKFSGKTQFPGKNTIFRETVPTNYKPTMLQTSPKEQYIDMSELFHHQTQVLITIQ